MNIEEYLANTRKPGGCQIEFELTEEGYAALSLIADRMARRPSFAAFTVGDALTLVFTVGLEVVLQRLGQAAAPAAGGGYGPGMGA